MRFPDRSDVTSVEIGQDDRGVPVVLAVGRLGGDSGTPLTAYGPGRPLVGEHARGAFDRPALRGRRADGSGWTPRFDLVGLDVDLQALDVELVAASESLRLRARFEALEGGSLRARYVVSNDGHDDYELEGLEVVLPIADHLSEVLDLTGRHERERTPQRHQLTDGLYLREGRTGRPGLDAATYAVLGEPGFSATRGEVVGLHVAWSGNSVLRVERSAATQATLGGGELLLPGEVRLAPGASYTTPWVHLTSSLDGLDGLAEQSHGYLRSLDAHPAEQPVVLNVWEAVYFDHDPERLRGIADRAAAVGVERFVLDDGWFLGRRDDTAGLGDWSVDPQVWPEGLAPLAEHVHGLGMEFGLWFEPEMVSPDSALFREHPDWVLAPGGRVPLLHRNQLVLDIGRPEVWEHVRAQVDAVLSACAVDYVKWDHNRDLLEAASGDLGGRPGVHRQTEAYYALLDRLRADHPRVAWESCASGGGRVDLGVLSRVQRIWASDMTDALARQQIQPWTTQLVAPEYVGAHVSSPRSHTTGRTLDLDFRAATALFGAFGIEWDLTEAGPGELDRLAEWVARHKRYRHLLHGGRTVRPESSDPAVLLHGVVSHDGSEALLAHVQLDESAHNRGVRVRVPGLDPAADYAVAWEGPVVHDHVSMSAPLPKDGPCDGRSLRGSVLARQGYWVPRRRPETVTLVHLQRL